MFGKEMQWTAKYVSRMENGTENIRLTRLVEIANVLEVDLMSLFLPPQSAGARRGRGRPSGSRCATTPRRGVRASKGCAE